jgi:hypothetical protein
VYEIYIRMDSDSIELKTDANSGHGTWGRWYGGGNLGSDDKIILVGDGEAVIGISSGDVDGMKSWPTNTDWFAWRTSNAGTALVMRLTGEINPACF